MLAKIKCYTVDEPIHSTFEGASVPGGPKLELPPLKSLKKCRFRHLAEKSGQLTIKGFSSQYFPRLEFDINLQAGLVWPIVLNFTLNSKSTTFYGHQVALT